MNTPETLISLFKDGLPMLTKAVEAVPEDKLDWKPADGTRTIRQVFTEAVMMPAYIALALNDHQVPLYDDMKKEYDNLSVEQLLERSTENAQLYYEALKNFPESDYSNTLEAPWGVWTYFQTMSYPYWNLMWHTGQINYAQTMYGDQNYY